jgi:DNA-directed RNA polymerase subunit K/omega
MSRKCETPIIRQELFIKNTSNYSKVNILVDRARQGAYFYMFFIENRQGIKKLDQFEVFHLSTALSGQSPIIRQELFIKNTSKYSKVNILVDRARQGAYFYMFFIENRQGIKKLDQFEVFHLSTALSGQSPIIRQELFIKNTSKYSKVNILVDRARQGAYFYMFFIENRQGIKKLGPFKKSDSKST